MPDLKLHPFFRSIVESYRESGRPQFHQLTPDEARAQLRSSALTATQDLDATIASAVNDGIEGRHGSIGLRIYSPVEAAVGTVVYLHGGGWVIGDLDTADAMCWRLVKLTGRRVVSVDYRLAPEHPYPQPLDDAWSALCWAAEKWQEPVVVAGESAGANLAAACALRARNCHGPVLLGQWLAYPVAGSDMQSRSYQDYGEKNWLLSAADMRWFWDQYCPDGVDRTNPEISLLQIAAVQGLAPTMILVGEVDPLRDEGWKLAHKYAAGGVPVVVRCDAGMPHGYLGAAASVREAQEALAASAVWFRTRFDGADS